MGMARPQYVKNKLSYVKRMVIYDLSLKKNCLRNSPTRLLCFGAFFLLSAIDFSDTHTTHATYPQRRVPLRIHRLGPIGLSTVPIKFNFSTL